MFKIQNVHDCQKDEKYEFADFYSPKHAFAQSTIFKCETKKKIKAVKGQLINNKFADTTQPV